MDTILILDYGSQYNQLIARRVRELNVYSELLPFDLSIEQIREICPKGIILSGGPNSVYDRDAPGLNPELLKLGIPVLGICYGMQAMTHALGGKVHHSDKHEYGHCELIADDFSGIFRGIKQGEAEQVWMSHGDSIQELPAGFQADAHTSNTPTAAFSCAEKKLYGLQFHPEVEHTTHGREMLQTFVLDICGCDGFWTMENFAEQAVNDIRKQVGKEKIILGLSGGVDSSVAAALLARAVGKQLLCIFIDNGLLRKNEATEVIELFKSNFDIEIKSIDASERFLTALKGTTDPEEKRKIIGREFIKEFEQAAGDLGNVKYLAQGTIYPDRIESKSTRGGPSATIKSHHNVGGLPEKMNLGLVEPLKDLFKDEVRKLGIQLGLPESHIMRHPFPGPGLGVRILGDITRESCDLLREADHIYIQEIRNAGLYDSISQAFVVLLPCKSVGVMGDARTYERVAVLRAVTTTDFMTADWSRIPADILARISNRIINEVKGINRVAYDISSKPPATIEWE